MSQAFQVEQTFRRLRARPLYTSMIVLCLALGIGATAIFSVVNTLLHPLVVHDIDHLVFTLDMRNGDDPFEASGVDYVALKKAKSFQSVGVRRRQSCGLLGTDRPEQLEGAALAEDYFKTLGVNPAAGRLYLYVRDKPGAGSVAIISYEFRQSHNGGQASILGQNRRLNERSYELIGVMPKGLYRPFWELGSRMLEGTHWQTRTANCSLSSGACNG
jgi:putative ABC transport system permease protein